MKNTNKKLRPVKLNKIFDDIIDPYRICLLGIMSLHDLSVQEHFLNEIPDNIATASIASSFPGENISFPIKDIIRMIQSDQKKSPQILTQKSFITLTRMFVIYSYNIFEESGLLKTYWEKPMIQFFYHIRNGCAHNNRFYFKNKKKLNFPAKWKGKNITISLEDEIVINDFFKDGDLIHLLQDISNLINAQ